MIIAVDGPAASGKGTIAKALARHYGLPCLDTGLLYRAVGLSVLKRGGDPDIKADALAACDFGDEILADPALRSEAVGSLASRVSVHQAVRDALIARQKVLQDAWAALKAEGPADWDAAWPEARRAALKAAGLKVVF